MKILVFTLLVMSNSAYSDFCSENNNRLEASGIGTIVFDKSSECQEAYKITTDCLKENIRLYEENPLNPRVDCSSPLKDYIIQHNNKIVVPKDKSDTAM